MTTQPTNEYINHERLTDLAQFAVPDGHDLWPRIEQAARASASGITTPRPGILSLGLFPRLDGDRGPPHSRNLRRTWLRTGSPRPLKRPQPGSGGPTGDSRHTGTFAYSDSAAGRSQHASVVCT